MQPFVRYHGHKLQPLFQKGQYCVATYRQQLSPLPTTVSTQYRVLTSWLLPCAVLHVTTVPQVNQHIESRTAIFHPASCCFWGHIWKMHAESKVRTNKQRRNIMLRVCGKLDFIYLEERWNFKIPLSKKRSKLHMTIQPSTVTNKIVRSYHKKPTKQKSVITVSPTTYHK